MNPPRLQVRVSSRFPTGELPDHDHEGHFAVDVLDSKGAVVGSLLVGGVEWARDADGGARGLVLRLPFGFTIDHQENREVLPK